MKEEIFYYYVKIKKSLEKIKDPIEDRNLNQMNSKKKKFYQ